MSHLFWGTLFLQKIYFTFRVIVLNLQVKDFFDILFTSLLIYLVLWFLKKTKSLSAILGIIFFLVFYALAYWFNLSLTYKILQTLLGAFIIILVVIFQEEIKRFFYLLGSLRANKSNSSFSSQAINDLVEALFNMAERKEGALIVIPGKESIWPHVTGGISLDGKISVPLILSLFDHHTPGHDGAVILENDRIKKFAVYLPLSKDLAQLKHYGTRHRAGLGLSEKTDALVLIVSEEKGTINMAKDGVLKIIKSKEELTNLLQTFLQSLIQFQQNLSFLSVMKNIKNNFLTFGLALIITSFTWILLSYPNLGIVQKNFIAPVEFTNVNTNLAVENVKPLEVIVTFSGRQQDFKLLDPEFLKVSVDLEKITKPDKYVISLSKDNLKYPSALTLVNLEPAKIQFTLVSKNNLQLQNAPSSLKLQSKSAP